MNKEKEMDAGPSPRGYHRLALFATCPQKFAYSQILKLDPLRVADPLALGSLGHIALMHHYRRLLGLSFIEPVEAMRTAPARIGYMFERAREIYQAYCEFYARDAFVPVDVERVFSVTAGGYLYTQRADLVVLLDGAIVLVDHKFQGNVSDSAIAGYEMSGQMIGYELIGRRLIPEIYGKPFGGVVANLIGTSLPFKFKRATLQISQGLVRPHAEAVAEVSRMIEEAEKRDPWQYRRNYEACMGRYGPCEFRGLCLRGRAALDEYIAAEDEASTVKEGSPL